MVPVKEFILLCAEDISLDTMAKWGNGLMTNNQYI